MGQVPVPRHSGVKEGGLPPGTKLEEIPAMLAGAAQEWYAREREEGRAEQRALRRRQAARKLDAATAERLAAIGERLLECGHGDKLLQRAQRLCGVATPGDDPSPGRRLRKAVRPGAPATLPRLAADRGLLHAWQPRCALAPETDRHPRLESRFRPEAGR